MSVSDLMFAQEALEAIGRIEERSMPVRRCLISISKCGGCGGPSFQQPCPICNFYPMGQEKGFYSPAIAEFDHFRTSVLSSGEGNSPGNLATWYFKGRYGRTPVMSSTLPMLLAEAQSLDGPSAELVWSLVVDKDMTLTRPSAEDVIALGWDGAAGLSYIQSIKSTDPRLSKRCGDAMNEWVEAAHSQDNDAIATALQTMLLVLRNHASLINSGNRHAAIYAITKAQERLTTALPSP